MGADTEPRPAADSHLFILEDGGVLFSASAQNLYALNTMATFIWCQLEDGKDRAAIVAAVAVTFRIGAGQAADYLRGILVDWAGLGVLEGADGAAPMGEPAPQTAADQARAQLPPFVDGPVHGERHYRLLNTTFRVRLAQAPQDAWVHPILAHLEIPNPDDVDRIIDVRDVDDGLVLYVDQRAMLACADVSGLAPLVKMAVWQLAVRGHRFFLDIHAGVVGDGRRCILFPAAPGSGKSTLTAALAHAGMQYFSDEVALIEDESFHIRPMPLAICVKSTGWDVLSPLFPELDGLRTHRRADGKIVRYLPPPAPRQPVPAEGLPARVIVFPRYDPDGATRLEPVAKGEALQRLLAECLIVSTPIDVARVDGLIRWIKETDCYALTHASLADAVEIIRELA